MNGAQTVANRTPSAGSIALTQRQKAAVVVKWLIAEGAEFSLTSLPGDLQIALTHAVADMRSVDRATLQDVVAEFAGELENLALSFPKGMDAAIKLLNGRISDDSATRLRRIAAGDRASDPWDEVRAVEPEALIPLLEEESVEVGAVLLSKLPVKTAAAALALLPGTRARRITAAVSRTKIVSPEAVSRIGRALADQLMQKPVSAFDAAPVDRLGAILNSSAAATRDDVLGGLTETDEAFAQEVKRAIFTFANIPERVETRDVPRVAKDVPETTLVAALLGASAGKDDEKTAMDFILDNMSKRMGDQLRDAMEERGSIKQAEAEAAMLSVTETIRALQEAGEIALVEPAAEEG